ncbi:MAG: hypothetical protein ACPG5W_09620 [Flavobacteriales bacterium]
MNHSVDKEITIWGASTAFLNFNPKVIEDSLNYPTINMGIDGTPIDQYGGLLKEYLGYTKNSKYIIIAVDVHGGLGDRKKLYHFHNWAHHVANNYVYDYLADIDSERLFKTRYVPFYALTQYDKHALPYFRKTLMGNNSDDLLENRGYVSNGSGYLDLATYNKEPVHYEIAIGERGYQKLKNISQEILGKGVTPIIAITPCYAKGFQQLTNVDQVLSLIYDLKQPGLEIFDYSRCSISSNHTFFKDNTHLNSLGAIELSKLLAADVKSLENE